MTWVGDSLFARGLRALARQVCRHPNWFVYPQILLFALSVLYTATHWKVDMDRDDLVAGPTHEAYMKFRQEFPGEDELAVVVQSDDMERNRQFVERLAARLEPETNLFTDVFYKGDLASLGRKALLFAPVDDLQEMEKTIRDERPFIQEFTEATNLDSFFGLVNKQFRTAKQEDNQQNDTLISAIPALQRIVAEAADSVSRPGTPVSPGVAALFGSGEEAEQRMYITYAQGRIYLVTARPRSMEVVSEAVERMRQLMHETEIEVPGLNVGLTGEPVLDYDEMEQATQDSIRASLVSLVICSLIFIYAYRQTGRPLKAVACLILGLGYTMAFTFLVVGHLNILTVTFAPILIGLAIDFGIHFITRYEEEMRRGRTPVEAVDRAAVYTGQGIITGALTTAVAFLAMGFTHFKGIQEMGIISGGGLVLCLMPMMTVLPVLLMKGRQNVIDNQRGEDTSHRARIENIWLQRPRTVVVATLLTCGAAALQFGHVSFDYNLLHMQSRGLAAVVYEKKLLFSGQSVLSAAVVADSLQQAREFEEKLKDLPTVASVDGNDRGEAIFTMLIGRPNQKAGAGQCHQKSSMRLALRRPGRRGRFTFRNWASTLYGTMGYVGTAADFAAKDRPELAEQLLIVAHGHQRFSGQNAERRPDDSAAAGGVSEGVV